MGLMYANDILVLAYSLKQMQMIHDVEKYAHKWYLKINLNIYTIISKRWKI